MVQRTLLHLDALDARTEEVRRVLLSDLQVCAGCFHCSLPSSGSPRGTWAAICKQGDSEGEG